MAVSVAASSEEVPRATLAESVVRRVTLALQVGLLVLAIQAFHLESRTFFNVLVLAVAGFPIHAALPVRYRGPFFAAVSVASVGVAFGVGAGAWLFGLGVLVIGLCHLPVPFGARLGGILALAAALVALRAGWLPSAVPQSVWPIFGAMFMFRTIVYLHTLRHADAPFSWWRALGYFFMVPNVCFPLFPVVDYKAFNRNHYDADADAIYQTGVRMAFRGVVQLILYRYVYYHLALDARNLADLSDVLQYVLSTFFLYLRVSGQFHLIVGILHLYGFRLPETHHLYFLSSSFTDFWRRINIYWKDFMMKLVYYPSFFRLRKYGNTLALVVATLIVFVTTWLFHSYQWFWLRGSFPIAGPDMLFWGILAVLVVIATLRETRAARARPARSGRYSLSLAVRTVATFTALAVLWSLWSAESVGDWLDLWPIALRAGPRDLLVLGGLLVAGLAIAGRPWGVKGLNASKPVRAPLDGFLRTAGWQTAAIGGVLLVGMAPVQSYLPATLASAVQSVQVARLNSQDAALRQRGYYENLDRVNRFNTQLWEVYAERGRQEWLRGTAVDRPRNDFLLWDLRPSTRITFRGTVLTTNRWGMRDRDYALAKPPGTVRIAVMGPSDVLGWGVGDGESFSALVEDSLGVDRGAGAPAVEVLNFAVHGYSLLQQVALFEDRVGEFQPDFVLVTAHAAGEEGTVCSNLARLYRAGVEIPYPFVREVIARAGLASGMTEEQMVRRLNPSCDAVLSWAVGRLGSAIRARGARPLLLSLRLERSTVESGELLSQAEAAGFTIVRGPALGLEDRISEDDIHPNAQGHRRIARTLRQALGALDPRLAPGAVVANRQGGGKE